MGQNGKKLSASLVVTVLNEEKHIGRLLEAINNQTQLPIEFIIVDGGSTDKTIQIISSYQKKHKYIKLYTLPNSNRSVGRNFGVSKSKGEVIVFTDSGCEPEIDWIKNILTPFNLSNVSVVSGYYSGLWSNIFQKCLIPYCLVMPDKAEKTEFYPATRSMAINRLAWDHSGGFDPKLYHNEDYAFAHWLKKIGYNFNFQKNAVVKWHPRQNLFQAIIMFFRFSLGDIQAGIIRPNIKKLFIRYFIGLYLLVLAFEVPVIFILVLFLLIIYSIFTIAKNYKYVKHPKAFFWLPVIQISSDLAIIWGTIIGILSKIYL